MLACTAGRVHTLPEHDGTVAPYILHRRAISPSLLFFSSLGYLGLFLAEWPAYRVIWQHPQQPFTGQDHMRHRSETGSYFLLSEVATSWKDSNSTQIFNSGLDRFSALGPRLIQIFSAHIIKAWYYIPSPSRMDWTQMGEPQRHSSLHSPPESRET